MGQALGKEAQAWAEEPDSGGQMMRMAREQQNRGLYHEDWVQEDEEPG